MIWYRKKKMTWGLVARYYLLISFVFTSEYIFASRNLKDMMAWLIRADAEFFLISLAFVSMCCVLYTSAMATRRKWLYAVGGALLYAATLWVFSQEWGAAPNSICAVAGAALFVAPMAAALAKQRACVSGLSLLALYTGRVYPVCMMVTMLTVGLLLCGIVPGMLLWAAILWFVICTSMLLVVSVLENRSGQMIASMQELRRYSLVGAIAPWVLMLCFFTPTALLLIPLAIAYTISLATTRSLYRAA